jgi:fatty acid desaturase
VTLESIHSSVKARGPADRRGFLSHPQDLHCVIYHLGCLIAYGCAFWLYQHPARAGITGAGSRIAFVLAAAGMLGWASGVDVGVNFHNHAHVPVFKWRWLNRWFGRLWTVSGGWPAFFWQYAHVNVHHLNVLLPADWTLPKVRSDGLVESFWRYCLLHWPWRYAAHFWNDFRSKPDLRRKALVEFGIFLAFWSIPFWIDPLMALGLWVLPQWIGNVSFIGAGMYLQHVSCAPKSAEHPLNHSNVFTQRAFNLFMFNIGYHLEHHDHPSVHWSDLPALHEQLKPAMVRSRTRVHDDHGYYHDAAVMGFDLRGDALARFTAKNAYAAEMADEPAPPR